MHFMEEIGNLGKKGNPELWLETKQIDSRFVTHLLSFNKDPEIQQQCREFNKYIYKIKEKTLRRLMFLVLNKFEKKDVFNGYVKTPKREEECEEFKRKAKKYWKWSEREWNFNKRILFSDKEKLKYYASKFGLEEKDKEKLGISEKVKQGGLDKWAN